jgi:GT2 family glycosyltransferase
MPQADAAGAEVIVVSDGVDAATAAVTQRHGAKLVELPEHRGLNAARNAGIRAAQSDVLVFIDQDVEAPPGWLEATIEGVRATPELEVFGGPIRARLEGGGPRRCGREPAPITTLDRGPDDRDVPIVWGANMAIRRGAFERLGYFDEGLHGRGNEDDWEDRYTALGGRIRYLADAGLIHRRTAEDARLGVLVRAAYGQGREARRNDVRVGKPRSLREEARVLVGCAWHTLRRRCAFGIVMGARSAGSLREALAERRP